MQIIRHGYLLLLISVLVITVLVSLSFGSQYISISELWNGHSIQHQEIIYGIRVPRIINAITVGALLSMAGLMIQNLVKNPLADPYILGLSGASASVQLAIIASGIVLPFWLFMLLGFVAAIASLLLLLLLSSRKRINTSNLLLSGVVIAFAYGAIISLLLTLSPMATTKPMLFWLMGDLSYTLPSQIPMVLLALGMIWAYRYHRELDLLARGEFFAEKCGVNVIRINLILLVTTSVFTAIAVSMAGTIGFIGLVVPHIARMLVGNKHAQLIPLSALLGAIILLIADTVARTIVAPIQLPVGIFTALFGVPVFLILLRKKT
ncbi:MAG TPA: iron ABC transporter permease [Oceanospirillales bacterium]|nr:iron ABC transporter permease [Oceanospirillales bacterium]